MTRKRALTAVAAIVSALALTGPLLVAQQDDPPPMGFFVTSVGLGDGADLGRRGRSLPVARGRSRLRRPQMARLFEHAGAQRGRRP